MSSTLSKLRLSFFLTPSTSLSNFTMGETLSEIPEYLIEWIKKQHVFWVASAPLSADGHVNVSPKGIEGTFHIVNSRRVWYEDLSGSGAYFWWVPEN